MSPASHSLFLSAGKTVSWKYSTNWHSYMLGICILKQTSPFWNYLNVKDYPIIITNAISPEKCMQHLVCPVLNMKIWQWFVVVERLLLCWDFIQCGCTAVVMSAGVAEVNEVMCVCRCLELQVGAGGRCGRVLHSHFHA